MKLWEKMTRKKRGRKVKKRDKLMYMKAERDRQNI